MLLEQPAVYALSVFLDHFDRQIELSHKRPIAMAARAGLRNIQGMGLAARFVTGKNVVLSVAIHTHRNAVVPFVRERLAVIACPVPRKLISTQPVGVHPFNVRMAPPAALEHLRTRRFSRESRAVVKRWP